MEKAIGVILLGVAAAVSFYIIMHLDQLSKITLPIPEKVIKHFKIEPFNQ